MFSIAKDKLGFEAIPAKTVRSNNAGECGLPLAEVISGCQRGDPPMQRELYERCSPQLYRLAVRMVGRQDALDVCQQTFLKLFDSIQQFAGRSSFMTWAYRIGVNECLQHRRKRDRRPMAQLTDFEPAENKASGTEQLQQREMLEAALQQLEPELRCIFLLREVEELSYGEIAEVLQVPDGTVASRLRRARDRLQEILAPLGE